MCTQSAMPHELPEKERAPDHRRDDAHWQFEWGQHGARDQVAADQERRAEARGGGQHEAVVRAHEQPHQVRYDDADEADRVASFQGFVSPEAFTLSESVIIVAMVVFGGIGHIPGVVLGAMLLTALPEVLRYVAGPLQSMTDGRLDAGILRPLIISLAMIITMMLRPHGLWPVPEHGKSLPHVS